MSVYLFYVPVCFVSKNHVLLAKTFFEALSKFVAIMPVRQERSNDNLSQSCTVRTLG
jgi:hypothetical protein